MKSLTKSLLIILAILLPAFCMAYVPDLDEDEYEALDTVVIYNKDSFHIKRISSEEFQKLKKNHYIKPSEGIMDIKKVKNMLGKDFTIKYWAYGENSSDSNYVLTEFRNGNKFRYLIDESEGFGGYYPKERIICYFGGHYSGNAFFVDSGDDAYDPSSSAMSKDKKYLLHSLESGQEGCSYILQKYDSDKKNYVSLCEIYELKDMIDYDMGFLAFMSSPFWVENTLYFRTGFYGMPYSDQTYDDRKYFSLTIPK